MQLRVLFVRTIFTCLTPLLCCVPGAGAQGERALAPAPPMGWNSWDSFALSVREPEVRANAEWMAAHLRDYGWQYVVIDEGWYLQNPESGGKPSWLYTLGPNGRYLPAPNRFPSAREGEGFKPLADYVHSLGLKFGIHIIRGIPREAVKENLPIEGSAFHAAEAADKSDVCYWQSEANATQPVKKYYWNFDNYGVADSAAGQAYYDSLARLYASWGVDFIKVDCISSPYHAEQIRMIRLALNRSGRPIVLSLSPGPTPIGEAREVRRYAQMWRIANDLWDVWARQPLSSGVENLFDAAAKWAPYVETGHWADADMLPVGYLGPHPSTGKPRQSALTHDEQRSMMTLWAMLRSPLMIGGDLPRSDAWTTLLLTNADVIAVDQHSSAGHPVISTPDTVIWIANGARPGEQYVAVFNMGEARRTIRYGWNDVHMASGAYQLSDLWNHASDGVARRLDVTLAPHACALYRAVAAGAVR